MMPRILLIAAFLGMGGAVTGNGPVTYAQPAPNGEDYFHRAAQRYVANDIDAARTAVEEGLQAAPNHPKLLALQAKLEQQGNGESSDRSANGPSGTGDSENDKGKDAAGDASSTSNASTRNSTRNGAPKKEGGRSSSNRSSSNDSEASKSSEASKPSGTQPRTTPSASPNQARSQGRRSSADGDRAAVPSPHDSLPAHDTTQVANGSARRPAHPPSARPSLSRTQAARILQALSAQELQLLRAVQQRPAPNRSVEKDW